MPSKLRTACAQYPCPTLTDARFCTEHARADSRRYDQKRGSSTARGYGSSWQRYRTWFLAQNANIFCSTGCGAVSTDVDHIKPVQGPSDPLFWQLSNHQGLCHSCHSKKTVQDGRWGKQPPGRGVGGKNL